MIAVSTLGSWILIAGVFALLWVWWRVLRLTYDLIAKAHAALRAEDVQLAAEEARKPPTRAEA